MPKTGPVGISVFDISPSYKYTDINERAPVKFLGTFPKPHPSDMSQITVGVAMLLVFGLLSVLIFPSLDYAMGSTAPSLLSVVGPAASISVMTIGVLFWLADGKASYSRRLVTFLSFFAVLMAFVKFTLSPSLLFVAQQSFHFEGQFADTWSDPSTVLFAIIIGVFLMYMAVFAILRAGYAKRLGLSGSMVPTTKKQPNKAARIWTFIILVGLAMFSGGAILFVPVILAMMAMTSIDPIMQYLGFVFAGATGVVAAICLAGAAGALAMAFDEATKSAIMRRNVGVFVTVAWIAIALLVVYHVLWAVYMFVLLSFWPFKVTTVVPK